MEDNFDTRLAALEDKLETLEAETVSLRQRVEELELSERSDLTKEYYPDFD